MEKLQRHGREIKENRDTVNQDVGNSSGKTRRRKASSVWEEMMKSRDSAGKVLAKCIHCEKVFHGSSTNGTSNLRRHLDRCKEKRNRHEDARKSTSSVYKQSVISLIKSCFDGEGYPTQEWDPAIMNSRKLEIFQFCEEEKENFRKSLSKLSCRFALRIKQFEGWCLLMLHYIDDNWKLKKKIIASFKNQENLIAIVKKPCLDLKINQKICSIVYSYGNICDEDVIYEGINSWFAQQASLHFGGLLFPVADYLPYLVGLDDLVWDRFRRIRECVAYVNSTPSNKYKFLIAVHSANSKGMKLTSDPLDDFLTLRHFEIAVSYKEAFFELEQIDPYFQSINLTKEQWDEATATSEHLDQFMDSLDSFLGSKFATTNMYFPKFFDLYMKFLWREGCEGYGRKTSPLVEIFASLRDDFVENFWSKSNFVLIVAAILDPRYKLDLVANCYQMIYEDGDEVSLYLMEINDQLTKVFMEYVKVDAEGSKSTTTSTSISEDSELDRYLKAPKYSPAPTEEFDVLVWWHLHEQTFPMLARMACDFLAIPFGFGNPKALYNCVYDCEVLHDDVKPALLQLAANGSKVLKNNKRLTLKIGLNNKLC